MRTRSEIAVLPRYVPGRSHAAVRRERGLKSIVKLSSNESPFGPFPVAGEAIAAFATNVHRYPEHEHELIERLAENHGVEPEQIALGNGADAIIGYISTAYLAPGDEVISGWPSFMSYPIDTMKAGAHFVRVPLRDGAFEVDALLARITSRTKLLFVCEPNNPTGGILNRAELTRLLDAVPEQILVVIDAAYAEFVTDPDYPDAVAEFAASRPNVVVLRTFSKLYGLAALRIGYAVGSKDVIDALGRVRHFFDVGDMGVVAAIASLGDTAERDRRIDENARERSALAAALADLALSPLPAHGNFVCVQVPDAPTVAAALELRGILVRPMKGFGTLGDLLRVSVGAADDRLALIGELEAILPARSTY